MGEFEDNLWNEIVRDHAEDFTHSDRSAPTPSRHVRPNALMGTGLGLGVLAILAVLVLGASTAPRAFAVTRNPDGTVTVRIRGRDGIAGANTKLHELGIRAKVVVAQAQAGCAVMPPVGQGAPAPQRFTQANWTIDPNQVPAGTTLLLTAQGENNSGNSGSGSGNGAANWVTLACPNVPLPSGSKPPSGNGNSGNSGTSGSS